MKFTDEEIIVGVILFLIFVFVIMQNEMAYDLGNWLHEKAIKHRG